MHTDHLSSETFFSRRPNNFSEPKGMTWKAFADSEKPSMLSACICSSQFGKLLLLTCGTRICGLYFLDDHAPEQDAENLLLEWKKLANHLKLKSEYLLAESFVKDLEQQKDLDPKKILLIGTDFQRGVWNVLLTIPIGSLVSYQMIAEKLGQAKAVRAAASAIGSNPISWAVPCHRVIKKNGDIHRYRWGTAKKKQLIEFERNSNPSS